MKIVFISDTHTKHKQVKLPKGDMIIHSGDFTSVGRHYEVIRFLDWYSGLPYKYKIIVAGNHDFYFQHNTEMMISHQTGLSINPEIIDSEKIIYIQDSVVEIEGIKIYGSPWTPTFYNWAFMKDRGEPIKEMWSKIPMGMDIVVTHGPPKNILDNCRGGFRAGCDDLLERIKQVNPKYHVFGHIHEGYGKEKHGKTTFINCSVLDDNYILVNKPQTINITKK